MCWCECMCELDTELVSAVKVLSGFDTFPGG